MTCTTTRTRTHTHQRLLATKNLTESLICLKQLILNHYVNGQLNKENTKLTFSVGKQRDILIVKIQHGYMNKLVETQHVTE